MAGKTWTKEEDQVILDNYKNISCKKIAELLPDRTERATLHRFAALGLKKPQPKVGDKFERLTILEIKLEQSGKTKKSFAYCVCDCGQETKQRMTSLVQGKIKSCGCLKREKASQRMVKYNEPFKPSKEVELEVCELYQTNQMNGPQLAKKFNITTPTIYRILNDHNVKIKDLSESKKKYFCNDDYFEIIDTEQQAYWVGFLGADGAIYKNHCSLMLSRKDKGHLFKFQKDVDTTHPVHDYIDTKKDTGKQYEMAMISLNSKKIVQDLTQHEVVPRKTFIFKTPTTIPDDLMRHFWRGYFDGDGCIGCYKNTWCIHLLGTQEVLESFRQHCLNVGCKTNATVRPHRGIFQFQLMGNKIVKNIVLDLYHNSQVYLDRKYQLACKYFNQHV